MAFADTDRVCGCDCHFNTTEGMNVPAPFVIRHVSRLVPASGVLIDRMLCPPCYEEYRKAEGEGFFPYVLGLQF